MRREKIVEGALAATLVPLALAVALPFREEAMAKQTVFSLGWDAAMHATEGLDLFDDLRLVRPLDALGLLLSRHWWGPVWALVSAPFQAAFGPSPPAASLPSLVAFVLAPTAALLLARRLVPGGLFAAAAILLLVAVLFLRSPMLLETSAWPMLESLGGTLTLLAWLFFAQRPGRRAQRAAFLAGAALFFLKYQFGFFVLGTFLAVVLVEEVPGARRRLGAAARALMLRGAGAGILALSAALAVLRVSLEARGGGARSPSRARSPGQRDAPGARELRDLAGCPDVAESVSGGSPLSRVSRARPSHGGGRGPCGSCGVSSRKSARAGYRYTYGPGEITAVKAAVAAARTRAPRAATTGTRGLVGRPAPPLTAGSIEPLWHPAEAPWKGAPPG